MSGSVLTPGSCTLYLLFACSRMTGCLKFLLFFYSFLSPSAGHLSYCSVYSTLILELVSCFHQFLPVLEVKDNFNSGPCVQSSAFAKIIWVAGKDFFSVVVSIKWWGFFFFTTSHICTVRKILPVRRLPRLDTKIEALEKSFLRTGASLPKEGGNILLSGNAAAVCSGTNKIPFEMGWIFSPND